VIYCGRWDAYLLNEYPAEQCETASDHPFIRIAGSSAEWERGRFRLHIADTLLGGGDIEGDLSFAPYSLPHCTTADGKALPLPHTWVLAAPGCRVEGELAIRRPGGAREVAFRGLGYHDHNYGGEDFTAAMRAWSWGRVHLPDATLVYYHVTPLAGLDPTQRLILVEHETGMAHSLDGTLAPRGWRPNPFLLASPGVVGFRGAAEGMEISGRACPRTVVDPGPFYLRFLSNFEVTVQRDSVTSRHQGLGFAEYLQPARLDWRWTWPMLKTRFIRSTG
jgi:carotenoid 1,2-hydratase